jgi:alpha-D-ribose 1-methylphosphonate 5-triphosphate diphosphatase
MARKLFTNARVVSPDEVFLGTVEWHAGRIVRVEIGATSVPGAEDLAGDYLLPGLVKPAGLRSHPLPGGGQAIEALLESDLAAAAHGITTIFDTFDIPDHADAVAWAALTGCLDWLEDAAARGALRCHHAIRWRIPDSTAGNIPAAFAILPRRRNARLVTVPVDTLARIPDLAALSRGHDLIVVATDVRSAADASLCLVREVTHLQNPATGAATRDGVVVLQDFTPWPAGALRNPRPLASLGPDDAIDSAAALDLLCSPFHLRDNDGWPLPVGVAAVTARAGRFAGWNDRGAIVVGQRADFVRVREVGGVPVPVSTWRGGDRIA